jgi:hypothetical protein
LLEEDATVHVLNWPKTRRLGAYITATISPSRLLLTAADGTVVLDCQDPDELRAFAMQVYAAAIDHDGAVQQAAVKASLDRRHARGLGGLRHRPFVEPPEPPMNVEVPA